MKSYLFLYSATFFALCAGLGPFLDAVAAHEPQLDHAATVLCVSAYGFGMLASFCSVCFELDAIFRKDEKGRWKPGP